MNLIKFFSKFLKKKTFNVIVPDPSILSIQLCIKTGKLVYCDFKLNKDGTYTAKLPIEFEAVVKEIGY